MLFHKKPKEEKMNAPVEEVQKMTRKGMSDKDIIKHLKSKGYSYEAIEGAMLKAVKESVEEEPRISRMETESPASENVFDFPQMSQMQPPQQYAEPQMPEADVEAPEVMLEPGGTLRLLRHRQEPADIWADET